MLVLYCHELEQASACLRSITMGNIPMNCCLVPHGHLMGLGGPMVCVVVSMFDYHRINRGSNPGRGGKIS